MTLDKEIVFGHLHLIVLFGLLAFVTHWIAKRRGLFVLPPSAENEPSSHLRGMQVAVPFAIYLLISLFVIPIAARMFAFLYEVKGVITPLAYAGLLQLSSLVLILGGLTAYALKQNPALMRNIWIRGELNKERVLSDFFLGVVTWLVAFPLVVTIAQVSDLLLYVFFGVESYEQVAVRFLRMALESPVMLTVALFTVLGAAPVIEEWLFRGFLQTFFRKHLGVKAAILLSAFSFALFHLSTSQGWGNVSLALSLFAFAWYLGFIYERQKSLFAPIGLHIAFNAVSALRILFGPEV